jgi:hypothetical protein
MSKSRDLQNFFEPSVHTTIDLIRAQIGLVEAGSKVKVIDTHQNNGQSGTKYLLSASF